MPPSLPDILNLVPAPAWLIAPGGKLQHMNPPAEAMSAEARPASFAPRVLETSFGDWCPLRTVPLEDGWSVVVGDPRPGAHGVLQATDPCPDLDVRAGDHLELAADGSATLHRQVSAATVAALLARGRVRQFSGSRAQGINLVS